MNCELNSFSFLLQPGPPPSGIFSSQPPSQAGTRRQDTSHDYQLLNEAAVSYLRQLEDEDEPSAQPQALPPRLAALEASKNIVPTNGLHSPTNAAVENARAHPSHSLRVTCFPTPAIGNKTTYLDQTPSTLLLTLPPPTTSSLLRPCRRPLSP
jgi:hypothetical protein